MRRIRTLKSKGDLAFLLTSSLGGFMFDDSYEVFLADNQEGKEVHYSVRHQVFCQEMKWGVGEEAALSLGREFDQYDTRSAHFIARDKRTGQWVGAMRMIFNNGLKSQLESLCALTEDIIDTPDCRSVEISRLCVLKETRRHYTESSSFEVNEREKHSERTVMWGLVKAALDFSSENNIKKWYMLTSKSLGRMLQKAGFDVQKISDPCDYYGPRTAFAMIPNEMLANPFWLNDFKNKYRLYSELTDDQVKSARPSDQKELLLEVVE